MKISEAALSQLKYIAEEAEQDPFTVLEEMSGQGICLVCGELQSGVEPDAEGHQCHSCDEHAVAGVEQTLITLYC